MFMRKIKINGEIILADDGDRLSDIFIEKPNISIYRPINISLIYLLKI